MWAVLCLAIAGAWGIALRWRRAGDAERLLLAWVAIGTVEMLVHDVGNERRFVFLIPARGGAGVARPRRRTRSFLSVPRRCRVPLCSSLRRW